MLKSDTRIKAQESLKMLLGDLGLYILTKAVCFWLSGKAVYYGAGGLMIALGLFLFVANYKRTGFILDIRGLLSLSWICGEGLACLKLSHLSNDWSVKTWICFALAYICFRIGYFVFGQLKNNKTSLKKDAIAGKESSDIKKRNISEAGSKKLLILLIVVTVVSVMAFVFEAAVLKFIPVFSDKPHAYSYFHISGVHYFTVCFVFVPSLFLIYAKAVGIKNIKTISWVCLIIALLLPILCVSRFQLIFAVGLAVISYLAMYQNIKKRYLLFLILVMLGLYVMLTVFRHHDVEYLNGIFEMKNSHMPIFITQPYMYVANNYENFSCLVDNLPSHTYGFRMAFPVWCLSGMKFVYPELVSFPLYITKTELTTLTWIYDFYYDFGLAGIIVFTALLGSASAWVTQIMKNEKNCISILFFGQIAIYMALSFFTTWWSNPTTWFWLGVTLIMYLIMREKQIKYKKEV